MTADELKKLAESYNTDHQISNELMTVLKNVAMQGKFKVSVREISNKDYKALKLNGFDVKVNPGHIDQPYIIYWD